MQHRSRLDGRRLIEECEFESAKWDAPAHRENAIVRRMGGEKKVRCAPVNPAFIRYVTN
jgi:hypothetical protein